MIEVRGLNRGWPQTYLPAGRLHGLTRIIAAQFELATNDTNVTNNTN